MIDFPFAIDRFGWSRVFKIGRKCLTAKTTLPSLHASVTDHCFNNCPMCGHWRRKDKHELGAEQFKNLIRILRFHLGLESVCLTGGDPLAHNQILDILGWLVSEHFKFGLVTAGYVSDRALLVPLLQKADWVRISLDAVVDDVYRKARGGTIRFSDVQRSIESMIHCGVNLQFGITATIANASNLLAILDQIMEWATIGQVSQVTMRSVISHSDKLRATQLPTAKQIADKVQCMEGLGINCDVDLDRAEKLLPIKHCYASLYQLYLNADWAIYPCCIMAGDTEASPHCQPLVNINVMKGIEQLFVDAICGTKLQWASKTAEQLPAVCQRDCPGRLNAINACHEMLCNLKNFY